MKTTFKTTLFFTALITGSMLFAQTSLTLTDSIVVSDETTQVALGTVSPQGSGDFFIRGRRTDDNQNQQVVSFFQFDVSSLTTLQVNDPNFSASFIIDYVDEGGDSASVDIEIGRNAGGAWNSTSSFPLHDWGIEDETDTVTAADGQFLVNITDTAPTVNDLTADVTTIVQDWVNGTSNNWGLVLYYTDSQFRSAGFENPELQYSIIPEPSTFVLLGLAGLAALFFHRRK